MKLILSPQLNSASVTYARQGDTLTINGEAIDLSGEWAVLEPDNNGEPLHAPGFLLAGQRIDGEITLTVLAPHGIDAPEHVRFPPAITIGSGQSVIFSGGSDA